MRRTGIVFVVAALLSPACDSGEADRLRAQLDETRAQLAEAKKVARVSERERESLGRQMDQIRKELLRLERPRGGLVVSIPLVGRLTWRCNDDREFSFTFAPDQATITIEQSLDGEITREQLHPGDELSTGYLPRNVHREWTVTYRHKPGTISAGISVIPGVRQGMCFIRNSSLEQNRQPN